MMVLIYALLYLVVGGDRPTQMQTTEPSKNETLASMHYENVDYYEEFDIGEALVKILTPKPDADRVRVLSNIIKQLCYFIRCLCEHLTNVTLYQFLSLETYF